MENELSLSPFTKNIVHRMSGDMKFLGIFTIIMGSLSCITIIGAIIGIPYIIAGMRLKESEISHTELLVNLNLLENSQML